MGFPFICTGIDLLVISLGDYYLQKVLESFWIMCHHVGSLIFLPHCILVFLCFPLSWWWVTWYLRAVRPWRTADSELPTGFYFDSFPVDFFFQASGLSTCILVGMTLVKLTHIFLNFCYVLWTVQSLIRDYIQAPRQPLSLFSKIS